MLVYMKHSLWDDNTLLNAIDCFKKSQTPGRPDKTSLFLLGTSVGNSYNYK